MRSQNPKPNYSHITYHTPIIFLVTKRTTVSAIKNNIKYLNKIKEKKSTLIKSYHKLFKKSFYFLQFIIKLIVLYFIFIGRENIKEKMFYCQVQQATAIYQSGTYGHCFFIVEKGVLDMSANDKLKKQLKPQDGFGQLALLYNTQRNSSVTTRQRSSLWVIDRQTFREAVEEVIIRDYSENRRCLDGIRFFLNLTNDQKDIIASALITQKFYKNQTIIQQGDPGSSLYYIKQGIASVYKSNKFVRKLGKGDSFGQQSLYYNTMRQLTIKADDQVTCLVLGRDTLNRILGDKVYDITFKNFIKWAFEKNPLLSKLNKGQTDKVIQSMKISAFKANQSIFRKGVSGFQKIVVIIEGSLKKLKNGTIVASKGQCWGQQYLTDANKSKVLEDEIVMQTYGVLAEITDTVFFESIGGLSFQQVIKKVQRSKQKQIQHFENVTKSALSKLSVSDLFYVKKLCASQFGGIHLVKDHCSNLYALKSFNKAQLDEYQVQKFVSEQKKILESIAFPFIIQLGKTFQTQQNLYHISQYIQGQNFYQVMRKIGLLSTEDSQFYAASMILILEYLHDNFIVCRDIKPQNFMVDCWGYLKLINMPIAKTIRNQSNQMSKTFTIIGTPHYMAPDIILGKGYNNLIDLWSLGVCLYEFLCGVLPFGDSSQGPYEIYEQIMQNQLKFPEFMNDKKAKKLIDQLLNHNPQQRHGGSFTNLKTNPWFQQYQWQQLLNQNSQNLKPPYIPDKTIQRQLKQISTKATTTLISKLRELEEDKSVNSIDGLGKDTTFQWESFGEIIQADQDDLRVD